MWCVRALNIWAAHFPFHFPAVKENGDVSSCVSACPTAANHMSLSNYLGQQHQIIPTEIILKGTKNTKSQGQGSAGGQDVYKCIVNAEKTEGRKMAAAIPAKA